MTEAMNRRIIKDTFSFGAYKTLAEAAQYHIVYHDIKDTKDVFLFVVSAMDNYGRRFWDVTVNPLFLTFRQIRLKYGVNY